MTTALTGGSTSTLDGLTTSGTTTFGSAPMAQPSGTAPIFGARAWCVFNGTTTGTNAPTAGGNVTSITRNGTGDYTINFTTALPSSSYAWIGTARDGDDTRNGWIGLYADLTGTQSTTQLKVVTAYGATILDAAQVSVAIFC